MVSEAGNFSQCNSEATARWVSKAKNASPQIIGLRPSIARNFFNVRLNFVEARLLSPI